MSSYTGPHFKFNLNSQLHTCMIYSVYSLEVDMLVILYTYPGNTNANSGLDICLNSTHDRPTLIR